MSQQTQQEQTRSVELQFDIAAPVEAVWNALTDDLENHRGRPRLVAWSRCQPNVDVREAWRRLMSADGLLQSGSLDGLGEGDRYAITSATGDTFEGIVHVNSGPQDFCGTVENKNNAFLRIRVDDGCDPGNAQTEVNVFLSTYDLPQNEVDAFEKRWDTQLAKLFA